MQLKVEITIHKPLEETAQQLFDEEFSDWLFQTLDFRVRERLEFHSTPDGWKDVVHYEPAFTIPALIKRALKGRTLGWNEHRSWSHREKLLRARIVPNIMPHRVTIEGSVRVWAEAPRRTKIRFQHTVEVRYPIFGPIAARLIAADMRKNFQASERLIHEFHPPQAVGS